VSPRTGRRAGHSGTRQAILDAALRRFGEHGYEGATVRAIALDAGVDPALVHHYFGSKQRLFVAAVGFPAVPSEVLTPVVAQGRGALGPALLRALLEVWDREDDGCRLAALLRSALSNEAGMRMLRDSIVTTVLGLLPSATGADDGPLRASLAASQIIGLALGRYVIGIPELVDATRDELVAALGPNLQRSLVGPLPARGR